MAKRVSGRKTAARRAKPATRATAKKSARQRTKPAKRTAVKRTAATPAARKRTAKKTPAGRATSAARKAAPRRKTATRTPRRVPKGTAGRSRVATTVRGVVAGAVAVVTGSLPWGSAEPDAVELLETDHRRLEDLLAQGKKTTSRGVKTRNALLATLARELTAHELIEEKVLYPALQAHPQAKDIVLEGYQEHHVADLILAELKGLARDDEQWGAKFNVLRENIEHHIKEEEGEMFRTARGIFSRDELRQLGGLMARMKAEALRG